MPLALFFSGDFINSPYVVPVAGCLMILGIVVAGVWSSIRTREIQSHERLAAIAAGVAIPPTIEEIALMHGKPSSDGRKRRANIRLTGIILLCSAIGLMLFFITLAIVLRQREILSGVAVALIPLGLGIAFLIDARIEAREAEAALTPTP
jgi:hypothetical protein